jgi:hypothetical protein
LVLTSLELCTRDFNRDTRENLANSLPWAKDRPFAVESDLAKDGSRVEFEEKHCRREHHPHQLIWNEKLHLR